MRVRQIKRKINEEEYTFNNIVATPYGSLIQTYLILNGITWTNGEFIKRMKKGKFPFLDDADFIQKTLEAVGLEYINIVNKPVAMCENDMNTVFCPFIFDTSENEVVLLPLFPDHRMLHSQEIAQANGTWKIVDWRDEEDVGTDSD